jgi:hypothetical protein
MLLRRATPLAIALAAIACEPSVPYDPAAHNPSSVDYAVFDPTPDPSDQSPADVPLPNDLALQPSAIATQPAAQAEVLTSFAAQGGWPADQDLSLTFDFVRISIDPNTGVVTRSAPPLDVTSINAGNLIILSLSTAGVGVVPYDKPVAADYAIVPDDPTKPTGNKHGTLTIRKTADTVGLRHWAPATYVAAVKGGSGGVKITNPAGAGTVNPRPAMYLLTQGVDLTRPENQGLIPGATRQEKAANAAQLEFLRKQYLLPFTALQGAGFPTNQIATMTAFTVISAVRVVADPVAAALGVPSTLPFPSDFLLDPVTHHLIPAVQDPVKGPFGALGPALGTLDGFSTTALITATTSGLIDPTTVNKNTVFIYELTATGPKRVPEAAEGPAAKPGFAAVSAQLTAPGTSATNVIGLQPAIPVAAGGGAMALPALHEGTEYAVFLTDGITQPGGAPTVQATLGRLLALNNALFSGGRPTVAGLSAAQAAQLEPLRLAMKPALDDLAATKNVTRAHVTMAYTFRTQGSIKTTAGQLAGLPYGAPNSTLQPLATPTVSTAGAVATTLSTYGVDPAVTPNTDIGFIVEASVLTFNKLLCNPGDTTCTDTGAFSPPTVNPVAEPINALVALPAYASAGIGGCIPGTGGNSPNGVCTVPLIVFRHGFGGSRQSMLYLANEFNKAGFAVAAIDAPKHGDRTYCSANNQCAAGATCVPDPALTNESDAPGPTPGHCMIGGVAADYARDTTTCATCTNTKSAPLASGNFLVSFNLFRTRDSLRQDIIDESQLIRLLSPNPVCDKTAAPTDPVHTCANFVTTGTATGTPITGFQIDPKRIYFTGQSLGAISGTADAAANPRVVKAALNVGGGTIVDIFSDPNGSFYNGLQSLLAQKGLDRASNPSGYLQFLTVAKWVLDPAEPLNFAPNLAANTISFPAPLAGLVPAPATRPVIGQMALCDGTVGNPFNLELYQLIGLGPASASVGTMTTFVKGGAASCPTNAVTHGFITGWATWGTGPTSITQQAQDDIAAFFAAGTLPPNLRSAP